MSLVFTQILIVLLYVAVGFGAGKLGLIQPEQRKYLSGLCTNLILPFTVLSATSQEVGGPEMAGIMIATGFMAAIYIASTLLTLTYHRATRAPRPMAVAMTSLVTYPNCTFVGLPLCLALFGDRALVYNAAALVSYNALFFTIQYSLYTGQGMNLRNLITPPVVSTAALIAMLALKLHFPAPVQTICSGIGGMLTPLSLMIIGVMLSESKIAEVLREKRSYVAVLLRNLAVPLIAIPLLKLLPLEFDFRMCVLVFLACPCGTLTSIYAIKCDIEPEFSAHAVLLSTIFFAVTLPMILAIGQATLAL